MTLDFVTVDVFTDTQFAGNPLAVVLNAEGLSSAQMQSIASEFNLSETTFVLPPQDAAHTAQVRIFTPRYEMPFAGHPNVGTAFALAHAGKCYGRSIPTDKVHFEELAGLVSVDFIWDGGAIAGARLAAPQALSIGQEIPVDLITSACTLTSGDVLTQSHSPQIASCGTPFIIAELTSRDALAAATPRTDVYRSDVARQAATSILLYTQVEEPGIDIRARMFAPHHGIAEDPATGSANVALIGLLAYLAPDRDLVLRKRILQGFEMGRPSLLDAEAHKVSGKVTTTFIGGRCVSVMSGRLTMP